MAIDPVLIQFAVGGVQDISRAFATIEQQMVRFEQSGERTAKASATSRVRTAQTETQERERAYKQLVKEIERSEQQATKSAEREAKEREKSAAAVARATEREAKRGADAEIKEQERAAREIERLEKYKMAVRIRSSEMAGRAAAAEAQAEASARARTSSAIGSAASRGVGRVFHGAAALGGMALGIGGGFAVADAVGRSFQAQKTAGLLINAVTAGGTPPPGATQANILGQASVVSKETGIDKAALLDATLSYARTAKGGDFHGAMANMGFFAKMSQGNVSPADIAAAQARVASQAALADSYRGRIGTNEMGMAQTAVAYATGQGGGATRGADAGADRRVQAGTDGPRGLGEGAAGLNGLVERSRYGGWEGRDA